MSSLPEPAAELITVDESGNGASVRFYWNNDRFGHVIEAIENGARTAILESVEGDGEQAWPPSPACQHLTVRSNDSANQLVMLTGAAGVCHWSITAEVALQPVPNGEASIVEAEPMDQVPFLLFDVACRIKSSPLWLGSSYRILSGGESMVVGSHVHNNKWLVGPRLNLLDPDRPVISRECIATKTVSSQGLDVVQILPPDHRVISPPTTVRWTYAVFCEGADMR